MSGAAPGARRSSLAELLLSLAVFALGAGVYFRGAGLSGEGGYARIGPDMVPMLVGVGLCLVGAWLLHDALTGGWRNAPADDATERGEHALRPGAFLWVAGGLLAQMALVHSAGFGLAGAALFFCVARGFGSTSPVRDTAIGVALSLAVFLFFVKFLNVNLPAGWLEPLLGTAGL
ncbi:MAG: tripartite tricarboxylate transporter TctB family protein [Burkholderiaceae bacterium]|nr:tripartite tricarboxylate transporter TctB family protein [Burkholderiaceae bacterium]